MLCEFPIFIKNKNFENLPRHLEYLRVPCGKCLFCRLEHAKEWGLRCALEWFTRKDNECYFLTLTYSDFYNDGKLHKQHVRSFIKKLRSLNRGIKFKYFVCGEFGEKTNRPHYHMLLFGLNLGKLIFYKMSGNNALYFSDQLNHIWEYGYVVVGDLTFNSAFYTARYAMKKNKVQQTIQLQSQGIGKQYFLDNCKEIINSGYVSFRGIKYKIPRYFLFRIYKKMVSEKTYRDYVLHNFYRNQFYVLDLAKSYNVKDTIYRRSAWWRGRANLSVQDWKEFGDRLVKKINYERNVMLRDNF